MSLQRTLNELNEITNAFETALTAPNAKISKLPQTHRSRLKDVASELVKELKQFQGDVNIEGLRNRRDGQDSRISEEEAAKYNENCRMYINAMAYISRLIKLFYRHLLKAVAANAQPTSSALSQRSDAVFGCALLSHSTSMIVNSLGHSATMYREFRCTSGAELEAHEAFVSQANQVLMENTRLCSLILEQIELSIRSPKGLELFKSTNKAIEAVIQLELAIITSWDISLSSRPQEETKLVTRCIVKCMDLLDTLTVKVNDFTVEAKTFINCELAAISWAFFCTEEETIDLETANKFSLWIIKCVKRAKAKIDDDASSESAATFESSEKTTDVLAGKRALDRVVVVIGGLIKRSMPIYYDKGNCSFRGGDELVSLALELVEDYKMKFRRRFNSKATLEDMWTEDSYYMLSLAVLLATSAALCSISSVEETPGEAYEAYCLACEIRCLATMKPPVYRTDTPVHIENVTIALVGCCQAFYVDYHECNFAKASMLDILQATQATLRLNAATKYLADHDADLGFKRYQMCVEHALVHECFNRATNCLDGSQPMKAVEGDSDICEELNVVAWFCIGAQKIAQHLFTVEETIQSDDDKALLPETIERLILSSHFAMEWWLERFRQNPTTNLSSRQMLLLEATAFSIFNTSPIRINRGNWAILILSRASVLPEPVCKLFFRAFCLSGAAPVVYSSGSELMIESMNSAYFMAYYRSMFKVLVPFIELGEKIVDSKYDKLFIPALLVVDTPFMSKLAEGFNIELTEQRSVTGEKELSIFTLLDAMCFVGFHAGFISPSWNPEDTQDLPARVTEAQQAYKAYLEETVKNDKYLSNYKDYVLAAGRRCSYGHCTNFAGFSESRLKSKKCQVCKVSSYCSKECQLKDWKAGHKHQCKIFKEMSETEGLLG